jgi:hypothetical protein
MTHSSSIGQAGVERRAGGRVVVGLHRIERLMRLQALALDASELTECRSGTRAVGFGATCRRAVPAHRRFARWVHLKSVRFVNPFKRATKFFRLGRREGERPATPRAVCR